RLTDWYSSPMRPCQTRSGRASLVRKYASFTLVNGEPFVPAKSLAIACRCTIGGGLLGTLYVTSQGASASHDFCSHGCAVTPNFFDRTSYLSASLVADPLSARSSIIDRPDCHDTFGGRRSSANMLTLMVWPGVTRSVVEGSVFSERRGGVVSAASVSVPLMFERGYFDRTTTSSFLSGISMFNSPQACTR